MGLKKSIITASQSDTKLGQMLRRGLKWYGIIWRYVYCLLGQRLPIEKNKIVFFSHKGKQYSCNPMYICEYLLEKFPGKFQIIWAFKNPEEYSYLKEKGICVVKYESIEHLKAMLTSKVIVTNVDTFVYLPHRKGQVVLDTWHGGGAYKTCGYMNPQNLDKLRKQMYFRRLYSRITLYLSSSRLFSEQTIRQSRLFQGEILEIGMPRNDILLQRDRSDIEKKVREYFGLQDDERIVLYAPTFRSKKEDDGYQRPDFKQVEESLTKRFGGKWVTLIREHHYYDEENNGHKATDYADMQELLYAAEVLITDYSSSIWDFSLMYKPVFLYCPDLKHYTGERNFYIPIKEWPFILCGNQGELVEKIEDFDETDYKEKINQHHRRLGNCESGEATKLICKRIYRECFKK